MAGIITNVGEDIRSLQQLRQEIENVKKALGSIDINVKIDIRKELEQRLQSLTKQYDNLVAKVAEADAKIMESAARIDKAVNSITSAQEKAAKANAKQTAATADKSQTAAVEAQAKAYADLKDEIDGILGTREQNIRQMLREQNAIRLINAEIAQINKSQGYGKGLSQAQSQRLQQLNGDLLVHKQALAEVRQELANNTKLDIAAIGSMNELSQSLSRMRIAYRALNEDERNSAFGKNLLASIQEADAQIKELDATIGNHQRNVGNYQGSFNGLNMSVQQIVRELPSAKMGINMFFMAISNNLPILADQIKLTKQANAAMKAAGQEPVPVWKQLVGSLFSWQSAMMVGITLLTVYGKDIANWVKELFKAKSAISDLVFAQQQLRTALKEARKDAVSEQVKLKTLYAATQDATIATKDRLTAIKQMKEQYPSYFSNLSNEAILAGKAAGAYRQLAADILKAAQARAMEKRIDKLSDQNIDLERSNNADKNWRRRNKGKYEQEKKKNEEVQKLLNKNIKSNTDAASVAITGLAMYETSEFQKEYEERGGRLKRHTEILNRNNKTIEMLTNKVAKIKATELNLENQSDFKPKKERKEEAIKQIDYDKMRREQSDAERNLENSVTQSRIDAMQEGYEKEKAQRKLNHKKELEDIDKQRRDFLQRKIDDAKEIFSANPKNKGKKFNASSIALTKDESDKFDEMRANVKIKQANEDAEAEKAQLAIMREYLKEYGSLQEQKAAINEEYNQKIAKADNTYLKAKLSAERDKMLSELDFKSLQESINWEDVFNSVEHHSTKYLKSIKEKLREALSAKDITAENAKVLADKIREIETTIGNRTDVWSAILPGLRERKKLTEETALAQDALNKAVAEQANANFKVFTDKMNIQEKLKSAGVEAELADINEKNMDTLLSSLDKGTPLYNGLLELFKNLSVDNSIANKKTQSVSQSINRLNSQWDKLKNMNSLTDIFGDIGGNPLAIADTANKNIQSAKELVTTLGMENTDFGVAVGKFADGSNEMMNAVNALTSGDVLGAINHTIRGFQSWVDIFRGSSNHERQLAIQEDISKKMDILNASITKLTDKLEKSYGAEAIKTKEELDKKISGNQKYYWQGLEAAGVDNYGKGHSDWYHWNKNSAGTARDIAREYGMGNVKSWQDLFSQLAGMKDGGGAKILEDIRTNHALDWWYTMQTQGYNDGKMGEWLTKWADSWKTIEDAQEKLKEQLTGTTEDNVFSDFMNSLNDLANGSEDVFENIADNWQKMVNKMVLNNLVGSKYQKQLKDWYEKFSNAYNDKNIDKKELSDLKDEYNKIAQAAKDDITRLKENGLINDSNNQSQKATINEARELTEDTGNQLLGRITAIQIADEQRNAKLDTANTHLSLMNAKIDDIKAVMAGQSTSIPTGSEMRQTINNSYSPSIQVSFPKEELQDIKSKMGTLLAVVDEMRSNGAESLMEQKSVSKDTEKLVLGNQEMLSCVKDFRRDFNEQY